MASSNKRESRDVTDKNDIDFITSLTEEDCLTLSVVLRMFGKYKGKCRFHTYDTFTVPKGVFGPEGKKNKNEFTTTVGKYIFNKIFIEQDLIDEVGWVDEPVSEDVIGDVEKKISWAVMEDRLPLDALKRYLMKSQKIMPFTTPLASSETEYCFLITKTIEKKKAELIKKYKKDIEANDYPKINAMEKELLDYAKDLLKDDPSMDIYNSGGASFGNNFKNLRVMKGLTRDPDPTKGYNLILSSFTDGIKKEEYSDFANSLAYGPYSRGVATGVGGYWEKLGFRATQHLVADEPGTDCGTKKTISVELTKYNIDQYMYLYMVEGGKLIELTSKNRDKYINKTVKFRFSSLCENKDPNKICHHCLGNKFYRLNKQNVGSTTPQLFSTLKNIRMKAFHDSTVKFTQIDLMKAFYPEGLSKAMKINEDTSDYGVSLKPISETIEQQALSIINESYDEEENDDN